MPYRFVHAADIHLDSPLRSLALRDPALADLIGNATRRAFVAIVDLCLDEQVNALLLSGDLYDGEQTSMKTARFLADQIRRLHEARIRVFVIRGNHDALSRITKELTFPTETVHVFGGRASMIAIERDRSSVPIAIHGISFAQPHAPDSLLTRFRAPVEQAVNIGLLHTSLAGSPGHDPYAPCDLADLQRAGFRYWALGHVHKRAVTEGQTVVVMPGMPQGRDIGEAGPKSVTLATIRDDGEIQIEERLTSVAQFEKLTIDMDGVSDWRDMVAAVDQALGQLRDTVASEHLVARLRLTGATPLAWRLRRDHDLLRTEAENQAAALGKTSIDSIEVLCDPACGFPAQATPTQAIQAEADPLDELRRLMNEVTRDAAYCAEINDIAEDLRTQLPPECRAVLGADPETFAATLDDAALHGIDDVLAHLRLSAALERS